MPENNRNAAAFCARFNARVQVLLFVAVLCTLAARADTTGQPAQAGYPKSAAAVTGTNNIVALREKTGQGDAGVRGKTLGFATTDGKTMDEMRDWPEEVKRWRRDAEKGDVNAQCCLGWAYLFGLGVDKDMVESEKWFRMEMEQGGVRESLYLVGVFYINLWAAAEQGDADSQYKFGLLRFNGYGGVSKDVVEAITWWRKAAEQGQADAQNHLGYAYFDGQGVAKDLAEAAKWFRKAAEQGHPNAKEALRQMGQGQ